jgi:uncharacterized protein (DUF427 family)
LSLQGRRRVFHIAPLGEQGANAVWTYEQPFPGVSEIAEYLAFYPNIVEIMELEKDEAVTK